MKLRLSVIGGGLCALLLSSCLTITEKQIIPPPWRPAPVEGVEGFDGKPPIGQIAPVYFSTTEVPQIDGNFSEWEGLKGVYTRVMVYGGLFNPKNTDGHFVVRTDGENLLNTVGFDTAKEFVDTGFAITWGYNSIDYSGDGTVTGDLKAGQSYNISKIQYPPVSSSLTGTRPAGFPLAGLTGLWPVNSLAGLRRVARDQLRRPTGPRPARWGYSMCAGRRSRRSCWPQAFLRPAG